MSQHTFYIIDEGKPAGPFTPEQLQQRGLGRDTLVWIDARSEWVEAARVDELQRAFYAITAEPEAAPTPAPPAEPAPPPAPQPRRHPSRYYRVMASLMVIALTLVLAKAIEYLSLTGLMGLL